MANFYKKSQFGRSMIEMLGVLAIIGVLSIVSIAAYSAAMFKYQLNQHAESFSLFLNNAIAILPNVRHDYGKGMSSGTLNKFFADTSMLPAGMYYNPRLAAITDIFKNQLYIRYAHYTGTNSGKGSSEYYINITIDRDDDKISSRAKAICRNVLIASKENAANIWAVQMRSTSENPNGGYSSSTLVGGTFGINGQMKRLVDAGLNDFEEVCSSCNSQRFCEIVLFIDVVYHS